MKKIFILFLFALQVQAKENTFAKLKKETQTSQGKQNENILEQLKKNTESKEQKEEKHTLELIILKYAPKRIDDIQVQIRESIGSFGFLLTGKTGIGKTRLAIALAKEANTPYHVFDMALNKENGYYGPFFKEKIMPIIESDNKQVIILKNIHTMMGNPNNPTAYYAIMYLIDQVDHYDRGHITIILTSELDKDFPDPLWSRITKPIVHVSLPNLEARKEIIEHYLSSLNHNCDQKVINQLSHLTKGKTPKEIKDTIEQASLVTKHDKYDVIAFNLTQIAQQNSNPSFITKATKTAAGIGIVALVITAVWKIIKYLKGTAETKALSTITNKEELKNASQTGVIKLAWKTK